MNSMSGGAVSWSGYFSQSPGYIGTVATQPHKDVSLATDFWRTKRDFEAIREKDVAGFLELYKKHSEVYEKAEHVGWFKDIDWFYRNIQQKGLLNSLGQ